MALSWNEIKSRAIEFSKEWENDFNEHAEAKSFMDAFFNVFGIPRRRVATFEEFVRKEDGKQGFIDLLWKANILIEMKSRGKSLDKAHGQARDYFPGIRMSIRQNHSRLRFRMLSALRSRRRNQREFKAFRISKQRTAFRLSARLSEKGL